MQKTVITDLILKCRQNDQHAFRKLVEMHQAMIFSFIFKMLCNEEEAKDAVQETFIKVWKHIDKYNTELKFSTWLFAIASNLCCDKIKFRKRKFTFNKLIMKIFFYQTKISKCLPSIPIWRKLL